MPVVPAGRFPMLALARRARSPALLYFAAVRLDHRAALWCPGRYLGPSEHAAAGGGG